MKIKPNSDIRIKAQDTMMPPRFREVENKRKSADFSGAVKSPRIPNNGHHRAFVTAKIFLHFMHIYYSIKANF